MVWLSLHGHLSSLQRPWVPDMPRTATFASVVLQDLIRELEYAPDETHRRQMDAAEALLQDLHPDRLYPEDFIVYRITSYRSDRPGPRTAVVGAALRGDLVNFIQRLSWDLDLQSGQDRGQAIEMDALANRLGISRRTLQRCRRDGLVMHWVRDQSGRRRLSCFADALDRFLAEHGDRIASASSVRRVDVDECNHLISAAREIVASEPDVSLNEVALRLAVQANRGHETVRRLLRRADASTADPIFTGHGPLSDRDVQLALRGRQRGIPMQRIASHFSRSEDALHRAVRRTRRRWLSGVMVPPAFGRGSLNMPASGEDLPHIAQVGAMLPTYSADVGLLRSDLDAYAMLLHRAADGLSSMETVPTAALLDAVETDVRWAMMLRLRALLRCWPLAVESIEQHVQQKITALPIDQRSPLLQLAVEIITAELERSTPDHVEEIPESISAVLAAELERLQVVPRPGRASARNRSSNDLFAITVRSAMTWPHLVFAVERMNAVKAMAPDDVTRIERRHGLDGRCPWTLQQLAESEGTTASVVARRLGRFLW